MNRNPADYEVTQTMELLWRSPDMGPSSTSPGPKPRFTVDDVVEAAIAVADANGMRGLSMRAVADRLDVTAMTLYGYVPGKDSLLALIYDAIHAEVADQTEREGGWRDRVTAWAEDLLDLYLRHRWALRVSYARPVLGPHEQGILESVTQVLRETDLPPGLLRRVVGTLFHVVRGTALTIAEAQEAAETTGITEQEWWQRSSTALAGVAPDFADRFPNTTWLLSEPDGTPAGDDGQDYVTKQATANLRGGLEVILDGIEVSQRR